MMMEQVSKNTEAIEHLTGRVSAIEAHMDSIVSLLDGLRQKIGMEDDRHNVNSMTGYTDQSTLLTSLHEKVTKLQTDITNIMDVVQRSSEKKEPATSSGHILSIRNGSTEILEMEALKLHRRWKIFLLKQLTWIMDWIDVLVAVWTKSSDYNFLRGPPTMVSVCGRLMTLGEEGKRQWME